MKFKSVEIPRYAYVVFTIVLLALVALAVWIVYSDSFTARVLKDVFYISFVLYWPCALALILLGILGFTITKVVSNRRVFVVMLKSDLLAKKITPQMVEQNPQAAIEHAFTLFENNLRNRLGAGPEVRSGEDVINQAFGKNGKLTYGATESEDQGVRNLMSGAYATFRNPRKHRIVEDDKDTSLAIIALIDMLIRLTDEAKSK
jgi:uncharacterized protein (TIGR02391 family)